MKGLIIRLRITKYHVGGIITIFVLVLPLFTLFVSVSPAPISQPNISYRGEMEFPHLLSSSTLQNSNPFSSFSVFQSEVDYRMHITSICITPLVFNLYKLVHSSLEWKDSRNTREVITDTIINHPGISLRGIIRVSNVGMGSVQYWLQILEQDGKIEIFRQGKSTHFFDASQQWSKDAQLLYSLLQNPRIAEILHFLLHHPVQTFQKDICLNLGIHKSLLSYYVKILRNQGIIEQNGRELVISPRFTPFLL